MNANRFRFTIRRSGRSSLLLIIACLLGLQPGRAQQANLETFGQNRVQYERFAWKFYDAEHFKIYHYDRGGRELARYVAEQAEKDIRAIEGKAGGLFPDKISIILYNSYDDYVQSNIGLSSQLQMQNSNPAGTMDIIGDKLVIYFTGNHTDLKRQLRQGMAQVVMEHLMFGESFREIVRNALLLDLPPWITTGYVDFIVDGWTAQDDNAWKNLLAKDTSRRIFFNDLAGAYPQIAGKAFWKYISYHYGDNQVKNLLYLIQLKSNVNKAAKLAFKQKITATFDSLIAFYQQRYTSEDRQFEPLDTTSALIRIAAPDPNTQIRDVKVSPRGADIAYVRWEKGIYKVIMEKTRLIRRNDERKPAVILAGGIKNHREPPDPDYPLLAWNNTGFKLGIIFKHGDHIRIRVYNSVKGEIKDYRIPSRRFDRVTGFTFMEDDEQIVLSAIKNGQSDLFTLRLRGSRLTQITDDAWDDTDPVFVSGGSRKGIAFLSNRPEPYINIRPLPNELPAGQMNAYFYNFTTKSYSLLPLVTDNHTTIRQIIPYGPDHFAYLADENGIFNRYVVLFARDIHNQDSAYSVPMTNFGRNIQFHQYNPASGKIADVLRYPDGYYVFFRPLSLPAPAGTATPKDPLPIPFVTKKTDTRSPAISETEKNTNATGTTPALHPPLSEQLEVNTGNYFQSEFVQRHPDADTANPPAPPEKSARELAEFLSVKTPADSTVLPSVRDTATPPLVSSSGLAEPQRSKRVLYVDSTYIAMRSHRYYLSFQPDFVSLRLDNNILFSRYQPYAQNGGQYDNPSLSGMMIARLFDKMEDYRFTGGLRVPANFSGLSYFLQFENFRRRTDWGVIFFREENKHTYSFMIDPTIPPFDIPGKSISNILQGSVTYPLDKVKGIHFHLGLRQDKTIFKAQAPLGLLLSSLEDQWVMSRTAFIYDNTINPAINIWNGFRYKLYAEYMYKFHSNYGMETDSVAKTGGFYNVGFDLRYYHKIYKNIIGAVRVAGAHAGGNQQIIYYLGGVENAFNAKFANRMAPSGRNNYAFQTLATNLRGYDQNARNGNTFALVNAEVRVPLFSTFMKRPLQNSFVKNLQAIAFVDVGNAWEGLLPTEVNLRRSYAVTWPANTTDPVVQVNMPNTSDRGMAIGYGLGLRTKVFGYFIRGDAAWNLRRDFHWYISIGTDF